MEIVEITQDHNQKQQSNTFDRDRMNISSSKDIQYFTKNHISSTDSSSDTTSYYQLDTLRFNSSPKRSTQAKRPSKRLSISNQKRMSVEENMNSFGASLSNFSPTIQSPTKLHQISNLFP